MTCNVSSSEIVAMYGHGLSCQEIAERIGVTRKTVANRLQASGVDRIGRRRRRVYRINDAAFSVITDEAAYWVGFLMADGCVVAPYGHTGLTHAQISLQLHRDDEEHIAKWRQFLQTDYSVSYSERVGRRTGHITPVAGLSVRSRQIASDLAKYGVVPQKSITAQVHRLEHSPHFWRGVVDGDGCLTYCSKCPALHVSGSIALMDQYVDFIHQRLGFVVTTGLRHRGRHKWATVYGKRAVAIIRELYIPGAVALDRKAAIARQFMTHYEAQ